MAGTPGNRTQLPGNTRDNGFEGRGEHQLLNHSQIQIYNDYTMLLTFFDFLVGIKHENLYLISFLLLFQPVLLPI